MDQILTTQDAANKSGVSRQSIYLAIKKKALKAIKSNTSFKKYMILQKDLDEYRGRLYSRDKSLYNGKPLYDIESGIYSLRKAADYLGIDYHNFYFHVKDGKIKGHRRGCAWIFYQKDLDLFREYYIKDNRRMEI